MLGLKLNRVCKMGPWPVLTHWGRVTHICVDKLTIIGSDNGLSPGRRQAIIWTNAEILLIGSLGTNFSEVLIEILTFSFKKMRLKVSSAKRRPFCLGLNELNYTCLWGYFITIWEITLLSNASEATLNYRRNWITLCQIWMYCIQIETKNNKTRMYFYGNS